MITTDHREQPAPSRRAAPGPGRPAYDREQGTVLAAIPEAPGTCRSIVRAALRVRGLTGLTSDAETVVTELASNAVRAMRAGETTDGDMPAISLIIGWCPHGVRIEVWDKASGFPQMREPDWEAESGRGLFLVNQVTGGRWGCRRIGGAKCTWAELGQQPI